MAGNNDAGGMLSAAERLIAAGIAIHWLRPKDKAPVEKKWQDAPKHTLETARESYRRGYNLGVRTGEASLTEWGYLHLIDLDVRDADLADEAWALILDRWPEARLAPFVISGSGGESRHLYFFTDKPFRKLTLGKSSGFSHVWSEKLQKKVKKYDWEVVLYGSDVQAVLPPSIHPDTGQAYRWGREIDFGELDLGMGPIIPSDVVAGWGAAEDDLNIGDDDDLGSLLKTKTLDISDEEVDQVLRDLPEEWADDRDQWYQVGMALHHQYEGGGKGFERWTEWSKGSEKYDPRDQARVWKSFKNEKRPLRMATLIKWAHDTRINREFAEHDDLFAEDDDDELAALMGLPVLRQELVPYEEKSPVSENLLDELEELMSAHVPPKPVEVKRPKTEYDENWKTYFQLDDKTGIKTTLHNVELIVRFDKRIRNVLGFNDFSQMIVRINDVGKINPNRVGAKKPIRQLSGPHWTKPDPVKGSKWGDEHLVDLRAMIEAPKSQGGYGLKVSDRDLKHAVLKVARQTTFHPVKEYLESVRWDGRPRLDNLFIDYLGAEDNAYHRQIARLTLVTAVTRIFEPGHKFDFVPILEGEQGKGKSTFIELLARGWFTGLEGDFSDRKSMVEKMEGSWICELPELQGFSRHEVTTIKGFISAATDRMRRPFATYAEDVPRQCIFIGSTNEDTYLRDQTGGRRFWPVYCNIDKIDFTKLKLNLDQLWAEAMHRYQEMRAAQPVGTLPLFLTEKDAAEKAKELQESRRQITAEEEVSSVIKNWLDEPIAGEFDDLDDSPPKLRNEVCVYDIWVDMLGRDVAMLDNRQSQFYARALKHVEGWYPAGRHHTTKWGRQRVVRRSGVKYYDL